MKTGFAAAVAGFLGAVLMFPGHVFAVLPAPPIASSALAQYMPGEVLVKFKAKATLQDRRATVAAHGHSILATLSQPGWVHVKLRAGQTVEAALADYRDEPSVEYAQPNYIYRIAAAPNDPQYGQLWAFKNTGQTITNAFTQPPGSPPDPIRACRG